MTAKPCDKPIKDAVDRLRELSRGQEGSSLTVETRNIVTELKASVLRHSNQAHTFNIAGGPQILVNLLSQCACAGQDAVLLLGLLGNLCALDRSSRDTVMADHKMIVEILSSTRQCDTLNTAARLVANLALDVVNIPTLQADGAVRVLVVSLNKGSNSCKRSVLRALRLLAVSSDCRDEIASVEGVQTVADCLQSTDTNVTVSAIQTLQALAHDNDSLLPLCNKTILQLIVRHCHHSQSHVRESAMQVLLNTAKCSDGRIALSSAGGIETMVGFMETYSEQTSVQHEVVSAVCLCCRDVISRQRLRDCGGLAKLIVMLSEEEHSTIYNSIISALVCYYFDEATLKTMVKSMGLIKALVFHLNRECTEPEATCSEISDLDSSQRGVSPLDSEMDFDYSPDPSTLTDMGASLPIDKTEHNKVLPIALDDLPVCIPPPNKRPRLEVDLSTASPVPPNFVDSLLSSPSLYSIEERPPQPFTNIHPLQHQVIMLLSRVSHLKDCLPILSAPTTLSQIINSFTSTQPTNLHVFKVLIRVFTNAHCFQDTLVTLAPSKLYQYKDTSLSGQCGELLDRLSKVADSPYGQGVLAHMLLRGGDTERHASCLALPLLCRSVRVLKKLMLSYGGFEELSGLATNDGDLQSMALDSLLTLALNTQQFNSEHSVPTEPRPSTHCRYMDSDHYPFDLTVRVCDGRGSIAAVPVHRQVLSQASDVFTVMLEGGYKEGAQDNITLRDIQPLAFVSVVHHLYGCGWQCPSVNSQPASSEVLSVDSQQSLSKDLINSVTSALSDRRDDAVHCLSVLVCAGRFLLNDLSTLCQHEAVRFLLPNNIVEMLYFAGMHECYCLSESCIRVVMAMGELRNEVFRDMVTSYVGETVLGMLRLFLTMT